MKKLVMKKLKGQSGETLTETLVALLIAALALTMLASMISSTTRIVTQSKTTMNSYYKGNNVVAEQGTSDPTATMTLEPDPKGGTAESEDYLVSVYRNDTLGKTPVISYRVPTPSPSPSPTPSGGS